MNGTIFLFKQCYKLWTEKNQYVKIEKVAFTAQTSLHLYETAQIIHLITCDYPQ